MILKNGVDYKSLYANVAQISITRTAYSRGDLSITLSNWNDTVFVNAIRLNP